VTHSRRSRPRSVSAFLDFLPKATYPTRVGTHFNSAFAVALALEYAEVASNDKLRKSVGKKGARLVREGFRLSGVGAERRRLSVVGADGGRVHASGVLGASDFSTWLDRFLPRLGVRERRHCLRPAIVSDRSDGKIAHLDGLNRAVPGAGGRSRRLGLLMTHVES